MKSIIQDVQLQKCSCHHPLVFRLQHLQASERACVKEEQENMCKLLCLFRVAAVWVEVAGDLNTVIRNL